MTAVHAPRFMKRTGRRAPSPASPMPRELRDATPTADVVLVPARSALYVDGQGEPGKEAFQRALGALYGVAWCLKMSRKRGGRADFAIGPLEARWGSDDPDRPLTEVPRTAWRWRLRLAVPADTYATEVANAVRAARTRRGEGSPEVGHVHLEQIPAQRLGRILHAGAYQHEDQSFATLLAHLAGAGLKATNRHLEVYLRDPRRTAPRSLRTELLLELEE